MTQSGQGGQGGEQQLPAGRPAHEGVVLPSDGGAPWIPGAPTGGQADQGGQPAGQAVPAGGQPWGRPWGPQSDAPAQPGAQAPGAYGYPQRQAPQQQQQAQPLPPAQGQDQQQYGQEQGQQYGQGQAPGYDQAYDQAYGQGGAGAYQQPQQPQHSDPYQQQHQQYPSQQYQPQQSQQPQPPQPYAQPLPPETGPGTGTGHGVGHGVPGGDADATQYIAPVPGGPGPAGLPPQPGGDADATQYIPPVPGGAPYGIRPGAPGAPDDRQPPAEFDNLFRAEGPAGATQQMPQQQYNQQQPAPSQAQPQHGYGYPGPGGQLPPHAPQGAYQSGLQDLRGGGGAAGPPPHDGGGDAPRRRSAHIPLIAAVVVGCAVIGLGAGAWWSMSGDDGAKDDKQPVASQSSPVTTPTTKAPADPGKPQAEALDKLLADSNNSRAAVISAVEKIRACKDLDQANTDLKGAAQQRRDLVTRLEGLTLDQLPEHQALNSSLTRAWKASAAADEHYAAWARQAKKNNKSVCKGGQARSTNETARANKQSGDATKAKQEASGLWNTIAAKYGLTKHTPVEL